MGPRIHDMELKDIIDITLKVRAGGYTFEAAIRGAEHEWEEWKRAKLPDDKVLLPGVITQSTVPVAFGSYVIVGPYLSTGQLRPIGFSGTHRIVQMPDLVPIAEQGYSGFDVNSFFGLFAPSGTAQSIVDRTTHEVKTILLSQDANDRLQQIGFELPPVLSTPEFAALVRRDVAKWTAVVTAAVMKPE